MLSSVRHALGAPLRLLDDLGKQAEFYGKGVVWIPKAVKSYKTEQVRLIAEVGMSTGALAVIGYHMTSPGPTVNNAVKVKIRSLERNKVMTGPCSYGRR